MNIREIEIELYTGEIIKLTSTWSIDNQNELLSKFNKVLEDEILSILFYQIKLEILDKKIKLTDIKNILFIDGEENDTKSI